MSVPAAGAPVPASPVCLTPRTLAEACVLRAAYPQAQPIAGATAAQLAWPDTRAPGVLLDLQALVREAAPRPTTRLDGAIVLSAFATIESLRMDAALREALPALAGLLAAVGSAPVRRLGTLGGNLCWSSGDLVPAMLALGVRYRFAIGGERPACAPRQMPRGDLLVEVVLPEVTRWVILEKVAFRASFSPTLITVAMVADRHGPRLAVGGGPTEPQRLIQTEALLAGGATAGALREAVAAEMRAGDDALASAAERVAVAARVIAGHAPALVAPPSAGAAR
jgi:CO/xanthine dehydrogenase FAD-binding subunit